MSPTGCLCYKYMLQATYSPDISFCYRMLLLNIIKKYIRHSIRETEPETAYNLWAGGYDQQPDNLMLALDNEVFSALLNKLPLVKLDIIDVGCGTGRHWYQIMSQKPGRIVGYDVSMEMLNMLKQKFPGQQVHRQIGHLLKEADNSFDLLVCTLTLAHISNAAAAIREWYRVIKPGGSMIITDYHPVALQRGGQRTFSHNGRLVAVKSYVYPIAFIIQTAISLGMEVITLTEKNIDDTMREWYVKQGALPVFEKFKGTPIIYGCCLKKKDVIK